MFDIFSKYESLQSFFSHMADLCTCKTNCLCGERDVTLAPHLFMTPPKSSPEGSLSPLMKDCLPVGHTTCGRHYESTKPNKRGTTLNIKHVISQCSPWLAWVCSMLHVLLHQHNYKGHSFDLNWHWTFIPAEDKTARGHICSNYTCLETSWVIILNNNVLTV